MALGNDNTLPRDAVQINVLEENDVRYWTEKFGVSREQLQDAVDAAGARASAVATELRKAERRGG